MLKTDLEEYLYRNIPIAQSLGVKVHTITNEGLSLSAPFDKNINHKKTVFGGSLQSVATLACWSLLYTLLMDSKPEIVIVKSAMSFSLPTIGNFIARAEVPTIQKWEKFLKVYENKRSGKITVNAMIEVDAKKTAQFTGVFAAYKRK